MADSDKDKNIKKIKIEHGKLIFRPQQKLQQNIIIPFPSFITNKKTEQIRNGNKTHKRKLTGCAEEWPIPVKRSTEKR